MVKAPAPKVAPKIKLVVKKKLEPSTAERQAAKLYGPAVALPANK